jgi:acyl dehydratase
MSDTRTQIPAETQAVIGLRTQHTYEVTAKDIRRYAQAIGDPNPAFTDVDAATDAGFDGILAPPLFCHTLAFEDVPANQLRTDGLPMELDLPLPVDRAVGGGSTYEVLGFVRPGDTITVTKVIEDIYRKAGSSGDLYFVVLTTEYVNQDGALLARERGTFVNR